MTQKWGSSEARIAADTDKLRPIFKRAIDEARGVVKPSEKNPAAVELGRKGGEARRNALSPEDRKRIASDAARKRWGDKENGS